MIPKTSKAHPDDSRTRRHTNFRVLVFSFGGALAGEPVVILAGEDRNRV